MSAYPLLTSLSALDVNLEPMIEIKFTGTHKEIVQQMREFLNLIEVQHLVVGPAPQIVTAPAKDMIDDLSERLEAEAQIKEKRLPMLRNIHKNIKEKKATVDPLFDPKPPETIETRSGPMKSLVAGPLPTGTKETNLTKAQPKGSVRKCPHCNGEFQRLARHLYNCKPRGGKTVELAQQLADHADVG